MSSSLTLAVIGDIHGLWDATDVAFFNAATSYDCILFVGDLPRRTGGLKTARRIAGLHRRALLIPGNHDGCTLPQLLAEVQHRARLAHLLSYGQERRMKRLSQALGAVTVTGYRLHRLEIGGRSWGIIATRPHAMGGDRLYFQPFLARRYGIQSMADSTALLRRLIDQGPRDLILLAHNGPLGLGSSPESIWGCDFDPSRGDFGEPDLRAAIDYARDNGRRVHLVVGGHMHHAFSRSRRRYWCLRQDGTVYVNAARVPRIRRQCEGRNRHHVRVQIADAGPTVEEVWVDDAGVAHPISVTPIG